ncbi:hypothetical protein LTS18_006525 [Coniosporium uncinatum]|uniref:Uncharacterized protein n=1 Tax=Coniosporium uncinatum TaxID=93489 RepID=A0ACC3DB53_9PEZI|nr:hypothetical protein LTS18_006525 [Coniosporium uncinatum]
MPQPVTPMEEGQRLVGETGQSYMAVTPMGSAQNVWSAVDHDTYENVFIIKQPSAFDTGSTGGKKWPLFQSEMVMHEYFKDCPHIRRQVDRITRQGPNANSSDPPRIVLEPTETTLADARVKRSMTGDEIRIIMVGVLHGLAEIHKRGLVYADLKMENIFVNGFRDTAEETAAGKLVAMIGDLGTVTDDTHGKIQPIAYRAPEVYFKNLISPAADVWGWGIIFCQLLEAEVRHTETGLYDDVWNTSVFLTEEAVKRAMCEDFELRSNNYYKDVSMPYQRPEDREKELWAKRLLRKGVAADDVMFLAWVLNPDPTQRPSAQEVLQHPQIQQASSRRPSAYNSGTATPHNAGMPPGVPSMQNFQSGSMSTNPSSSSRQSSPTRAHKAWTEPLADVPVPGLYLPDYRNMLSSMGGGSNQQTLKDGSQPQNISKDMVPPSQSHGGPTQSMPQSAPRQSQHQQPDTKPAHKRMHSEEPASRVVKNAARPALPDTASQNQLGSTVGSIEGKQPQAGNAAGRGGFFDGGLMSRLRGD